MDSVLSYIAVILPLFIIQVGLMVFCLVKIHTEGVGNLTKLAWTLIVIFVNLFGSIAFLLLGRKKDEYDPGE